MDGDDDRAVRMTVVDGVVTDDDGGLDGEDLLPVETLGSGLIVNQSLSVISQSSRSDTRNILRRDEWNAMTSVVSDPILLWQYCYHPAGTGMP